MCDYDFDAPDFYREEDRIAQKNYQCSECFRGISKGEKYRNTFGKWCSKTSTFKTCCHCLMCRNYMQTICNGYAHGNLQNEIFEHFDYDKKMLLARMFIGMERKWKSFKSDKLVKVKEYKNQCV